MRIFHRRAALVAVFFTAWLLVGCGTTAEPEKEPEKKKEEQARAVIIGRIASIAADRKFVLIQSYGTWSVANGTVLTTHGPEERAANLLVTGEKLGQYAAADIQSGEAVVGDAVLLLPTQAPKPPEPVVADVEPQVEPEKSPDF